MKRDAKIGLAVSAVGLAVFIWIQPSSPPEPEATRYHHYEIRFKPADIKPNEPQPKEKKKWTSTAKKPARTTKDGS